MEIISPVNSLCGKMIISTHHKSYIISTHHKSYMYYTTDPLTH